MDKEQAEKKARELLPKRDNKIKVDSGYELVRQGKNQTLAVVIPIVADLLMREAELENNYRLSKDCTDIWKNNYIMAKKQLSASQKKVEELDIILKHSKKWCDDIYDKYESLKQSQELVCYSCGEPIKYDNDRPECYCNDCLPMDSKLKQSQGKVLNSPPKKLQQTALTLPDANCFATCLAMLLGLDVEDVPNFHSDDEYQWFFKYKEWLGGIGYDILALGGESWDGEAKNTQPDVYCIASGRTGSGNLLHATVYKKDKLYHDPYPEGKGITSVNNWMYLIPKEIIHKAQKGE